jgi:signal transduction histidine kinase/PAS domain-containing protein
VPAPIDFEALFDVAPNPYMLLDPALTFVGVNAAYLRVTGRTRDELIGRNLFEAFPGNPDDPDDSSVRQLRASLERVIETGAPDTIALIRYAIPRNTPEGVVFEERFWSATHTPLMDDQGEVAQILQHTVDVTELQDLRRALRAAEQERQALMPHDGIESGVLSRAQAVQEANRTLEAERQRLRRLFEQAPGFIAATEGPDHVFILANEAYRQVIGHRPVLGLPVREALPEVVEQGFLALLDQVYASGEPFVGRGVSVMIQKAPGAPPEEVCVDFVYQPVIEADGSVSGIFVQGNDVTDQAHVQREMRRLNESLEARVAERTEQLEARNRELQEFAYVASHDLQEPLRKISTFADMVRADYGDALDEQGQYYLERMHDAASRMARLINALLSYSRATTQAPRFTHVDLDEVARDVLNDLQMRLDETGGRVEIADLPEVEADVVQMRQLFQNLIGNALKFHRDGVPPVIEVTGTRERKGTPPMVRLEVRDNGIGFDAKYAERLFAPFKRLHNRGQYEGTGIGLAIVRRIVERHGGTISAASTPGQGSTFTLLLPVVQSSEAAPGVAA